MRSSSSAGSRPLPSRSPGRAGRAPRPSCGRRARPSAACFAALRSTFLRRIVTRAFDGYVVERDRRQRATSRSWVSRRARIVTSRLPAAGSPSPRPSESRSSERRRGRIPVRRAPHRPEAAARADRGVRCGSTGTAGRDADDRRRRRARGGSARGGEPASLASIASATSRVPSSRPSTPGRTSSCCRRSARCGASSSTRRSPTACSS